MVGVSLFSPPLRLARDLRHEPRLKLTSGLVVNFRLAYLGS